MEWQEIIKKIVSEFKSDERNLASLKIRLSGLYSINLMMPNEYNPNLLLQKGKVFIKNKLSDIKTLNGAENTSLNAIYHLLNGTRIPIN